MSVAWDLSELWLEVSAPGARCPGGPDIPAPWNLIPGAPADRRPCPCSSSRGLTIVCASCCYSDSMLGASHRYSGPAARVAGALTPHGRNLKPGAVFGRVVFLPCKLGSSSCGLLSSGAFASAILGSLGCRPGCRWTTLARAKLETWNPVSLPVGGSPRDSSFPLTNDLWLRSLGLPSFCSADARPAGRPGPCSSPC
jgi:hypothetical protein